MLRELFLHLITITNNSHKTTTVTRDYKIRTWFSARGPSAGNPKYKVLHVPT